MGGDRLRPSIFERLEPGQENNIPLLLDFMYGEFIRKVDVLETQVKGRLSKHESDLERADRRLQSIEHCPCAVHRDPAHTCVILDVRDALAGIRAENAAQLAKINERLAWWGGGLAMIVILIEVLSRILPVLWR
jgi:hypothetical protein